MLKKSLMMIIHVNCVGRGLQFTTPEKFVFMRCRCKAPLQAVPESYSRKPWDSDSRIYGTSIDCEWYIASISVVILIKDRIWTNDKIILKEYRLNTKLSFSYMDWKWTSHKVLDRITMSRTNFGQKFDAILYLYEQTIFHMRQTNECFLLAGHLQLRRWPCLLAFWFTTNNLRWYCDNIHYITFYGNVVIHRIYGSEVNTKIAYAMTANIHTLNSQLCWRNDSYLEMTHVKEFALTHI